MRSAAMKLALLLTASPVLAWTLAPLSPRPTAACGDRSAIRVSSAPRMESLAQKMFGDVFGGLKSAAEKLADAVSSGDEAEEAPEASVPAKADAVADDLDAR